VARVTCENGYKVSILSSAPFSPVAT
jgi:hypothetical protein